MVLAMYKDLLVHKALLACANMHMYERRNNSTAAAVNVRHGGGTPVSIIYSRNHHRPTAIWSSPPVVPLVLLLTV
jgi:hypothetical protein